MSVDRPIHVIGCGSSSGDDAVAWHVLRQLAHAGLADSVELHVIGGGHQLLDRLDGRGTLVIIDAMSSGSPPGTVRRFEWPDLPFESLRPGTTHDLGLAESLRLAETLGLLPPRVVVWCVEASTCEAQDALTPAVAEAVPELTLRIAEELNHARNVALARAARAD